MANGCEAPPRDGEGVAEPDANFVDDAADEEKAQCVRGLKSYDNVAVLGFTPTDFDLQHWREEAEDLAVHVVNGVCDEEQCADAPSNAGHLWRKRRKGRS